MAHWTASEYWAVSSLFRPLCKLWSLCEGNESCCRSCWQCWWEWRTKYSILLLLKLFPIILFFFFNSFNSFISFHKCIINSIRLLFKWQMNWWAVNRMCTKGPAGCWLEGTVYVSFSIPLSGQCNQRDCYATYSPIIADSNDSNSPIWSNTQNVRTETAVGATFFVRDSVHSPATSGTNRSALQSSSSSGASGLTEDCLHLGIRDMCRWIPTYNGEAFGLKHSVTQRS